jgi:succinate--hydroxymethylglutarate CoA-transferase
MHQILNHSRYGEIPSLGSATKFSSFEVTAGWTAPPLIGEDTDAVLNEWLGLSNSELTQLREKKII